MMDNEQCITTRQTMEPQATGSATGCDMTCHESKLSSQQRRKDAPCNSDPALVLIEFAPKFVEGGDDDAWKLLPSC